MTEEQMKNRAQRVFADSVDGLDAHTLSRLNQGRQKALEAATPRSAVWRYAPLGGLAAAALVAAFMLQSPGVTQVAPTDALSDFDILLSEDSLDMLEDLEFFAWMELHESSLDDPAG